MNPNQIKPEDRYTVVRHASGADEGRYKILCKEHGHMGYRDTLISAKNVRDDHERRLHGRK